MKSTLICLICFFFIFDFFIIFYQNINFFSRVYKNFGQDNISITLLFFYPVNLLGGYINHQSFRRTPSESHIYQRYHQSYHISLSSHIYRQWTISTIWQFSFCLFFLKWGKKLVWVTHLVAQQIFMGRSSRRIKMLVGCGLSVDLS